MDERRPFLLIAWALLLGVFVWTILPVLTPLVLFLVLAYLLSPLWGSGTYRRLVVTLGALSFLWLLHAAGSILAPFALAFVIAYVANPLVERAERRGVSRGVGALALLLVFALLVLLVLLLVVPLAAEQGREFATDFPTMVDDLIAWWNGRVAALDRDSGALLRGLPFERALIRSEDVSAWLAARATELRPSWRTAAGLGQGLQWVMTILGFLVLTPVLAYYLLRDFPRMKQVVADALPEDRRDVTLGFLGEYDDLLGEFMRGQLLVALFVGLATWIGFEIAQFPNAVLLGAVAGVFNLVPYLGLIVSLVPALFIAILTPPIGTSLLKVAIVFFAIQSLDNYVLSPRIIGDRVGLHPVWVMLAILAFGSFFGIVGILLAIPIAVLVKLVLIHSMARYKQSVYYREADSVSEDV